jgi:pimeloyl-ACP methyl ester carboxylesterase
MKPSKGILAVAGLLLAGSMAVHAESGGNGFRGDRLEFSVMLHDSVSGAAVECTMVGYLYYRGTYHNRILQVAVHGATYNHTYWNFPAVNGEDYSYAHYMTKGNYAVLALDQVGAGESCHPDGLTVVDLPNTTSALVQVLGAMRSSANPTGEAFAPIVLVGHSAGSINVTAAQAATGSHAADALVITGSRHIVAPPLPPGIAAIAPLVPTLAAAPYFSLDAASRNFLFYYAAGADPAVMAADNATADQWTGGQVSTTFIAFVYAFYGLPPLDGMNAVTGPVLIQLGDHDALFPAGAPEQEAAQWTSTTVETQEIANIGHDFNLHYAREESWRGIDAWLRRVLNVHKVIDTPDGHASPMNGGHAPRPWLR